MGTTVGLRERMNAGSGIYVVGSGGAIVQFWMWYKCEMIRSVLQKNNSGMKNGLNQEEKVSTQGLTVIMIPIRDMIGLTRRSQLKVKESEDNGRTKGNTLDGDGELIQAQEVA